MTDLLVFGYLGDERSPSLRERMTQFAALLGESAGIEIALMESKSYGDLAYAMNGGKINLAWLPPIPFIALERRGAAVALVGNQRDGAASFLSVIIVLARSKMRALSSLKGKRAAWVDPQSAAGYVIPRIGLAALGVDPRTAFADEKFLLSHRAVVAAVEGGAADFGATYGGFDAQGVAVRGAWLDIADGESKIRVLASFGEIPSDVIAARAGLAEPVREKLTRALVGIARDKGNQLLIRDVFGADEFRRFVASGYDVLTRAVTDASTQGLIQGDSRR